MARKFKKKPGKGAALVVIHVNGNVSLILPDNYGRTSSSASLATLLALIGKGKGPFQEVFDHALRVLDEEVRCLTQKSKRAA